MTGNGLKQPVPALGAVHLSMVLGGLVLLLMMLIGLGMKLSQGGIISVEIVDGFRYLLCGFGLSAGLRTLDEDRSNGSHLVSELSVNDSRSITWHGATLTFGQSEI